MKIYQVNARSLQPFYTADRKEALKVFCYLRKYGPPTTIRTLSAAKAQYKIMKGA